MKDKVLKIKENFEKATTDQQINSVWVDLQNLTKEPKLSLSDLKEEVDLAQYEITAKKLSKKSTVGKFLYKFMKAAPSLSVFTFLGLAGFVFLFEKSMIHLSEHQTCVSVLAIGCSVLFSICFVKMELDRRVENERSNLIDSIL